VYMVLTRTILMSEHSSRSVHGYAWSDKGNGYSLVDPTSTDILHLLANEIRRQLEENI
jgi:hypothetical protein